MSQAFPAKYFYHFELKVDSKELCGVRWTDAADGRKHYAQEALNDRLRAALLRRSSEVFFLLVQQVSDVHEVVCKHSGADQHFKALRSLGQTALHAAAAKEHGDAALNACPEALSFLELRALFKRFAFRAPFPTALRNADELHSAILACFDVLIAEKAAVRTVPIGSQTESLLMTLQRRCDVDVIGGITFKHAVLGDQTATTFSEKDLVAKLHWFLYFPPLDQIGVGFKDRIDLLISWNLLSLEHAPAALIDDADTELAVVIDFPSKLADHQIVHQLNGALIFGLFEHPSGILEDLLGGPNELAIFTLLLGVALPRCHALDLLHATPCTACAVSKVIDSFGKNLPKTTDEPRQDAHHIPEQSIIGWMMDIGFGNRRIDAQSLAVLQSQIDGSFKHQVIDSLYGFGQKFVKGPIESVVLGYAPAVKTRESAQRVSVSDSFAKFPIVPVLHSHQDQRPKHLRRGHGRAAGGRLFQTPLKILAHRLDDLWPMIEELADPLENWVEIDPLSEKLQISEADLRLGDSCHG